MIKSPTVLILGAGASADYGFPTGRKLLLDICKYATDRKLLFEFLNQHMDFSGTDIREFRAALLKSQAPSVDLFLENRREFEKLGKAAIAASLIPYESFDQFERSETVRWYEFLFSLMIEGGRFEDNALSVITLNYDRSLEAFFLLALWNLHGLTPDQAEERAAKIPVIHLYGRLGSRLWKPITESGRGYEPKLESAWVREAATQIRIMHEVGEHDETDAVGSKLFQADEIIFLGFGFHSENIKRLHLQEIAEHRERAGRSHPRLFASRFGMGEGDISRAKNLLPFPRTHFGKNQHATITDFLKETPCLMPKAASL